MNNSLKEKQMSFYKEYLKYKDFDINKFFQSVTEYDIQRILQKSKLTNMDYLALLSPTAGGFLEDIAQKAHDVSVRNFGKTILLFTPMYVSNYCSNQCVYCGFNGTNKIHRKQLSYDELEQEAKAIAQTGLKHILVLTGDAKKIATIDYLKNCTKILSKYFTSISIEIYALETDEYKELVDAGVDSMAMYQETYNQELYKTLHLKGPKTDYMFRINAPERGCIAGMRSLNIGALLGLDMWQKDIFFTGMHANYFQTKYPEVEISISLPRMRPHTGDYEPNYIITDKDLVQIMLAFRLFIPRGGITISTRERQSFRDNVMSLGVNKMSAGSNTAVGGRTQGEQDAQFDISDHRGVVEMEMAIKKRGYQPIYKDWQPIMDVA